MLTRSLHRSLVPAAPRHRRTEVDEVRDPALRARTAAVREVVPGLQAPRLVSSYAGSIDRILFCFPAWAVTDPALVAGYRSVIGALRPGTRFVVAHNESARPDVEPWFTNGGHSADDVAWVPLPDYVQLTDWAEDAYVALHDGVDRTGWLMEPWSFGRGGDALIADAVEEHTDLRASGAPLVFQGGNCLVGPDLWLLGKDYFADTVALLTGPRPPVEVPPGTEPAAFARDLFTDYVDAARRLVVVGTRKPIPLRDLVGTREGDDYYLDLPSGGAGAFQPIFHIDMFVTLVGPGEDGRMTALVGSPRQADRLLGTASPFALHDVYDNLAAALRRAGLSVHRNPLVHRPTVSQVLPLARLKDLATGPGGEDLADAVDDLAAVGAVDTTPVHVREWHHVTWNNCLVEDSASVGRHVYLPTYGHGDDADLAVLDSHMADLWDDLGFTVHALADFGPFARRQGVVHCIKKYVDRGE